MAILKGVQEERISININSTWRSPRFEIAGEIWILVVHPSGTPQSKEHLAVFLEASELGHSQCRDNVQYRFTIVNPDPVKSVFYPKHTWTFRPDAKSIGFHNAILLTTLRDPKKGFLSDGHFKIATYIAAQAKDASCSMPPPLSLEGDVQLSLDDGSTMSAHSLYLSHASTVFKNAIYCKLGHQTPIDVTHDESDDTESPSAKRPKVMAKLPLPGATRRQVQLLLQTLYCVKKESWLDSLCPPELIDLATVLDKYSAVELLQVVDEVLVKKTAIGPAQRWLTVLDAPGQHQLARRLRLTSYEAHVGRFLGRHAHQVDLTRLDASTAAVLEGTRTV